MRVHTSTYKCGVSSYACGGKVKSVKVARRGTFDASTSLSSAADTFLRQSGDQVPSLDGQYAISRSCGLYVAAWESRARQFVAVGEVIVSPRSTRSVARAPFLDMSAISGPASLTESHGRGRSGWKFFQTAFWGVRGLPKSFLGMCLAFRDSLRGEE